MFKLFLYPRLLYISRNPLDHRRQKYIYTLSLSSAFAYSSQRGEKVDICQIFLDAKCL
jgi:hypothetical protein